MKLQLKADCAIIFVTNLTNMRNYEGFYITAVLTACRKPADNNTGEGTAEDIDSAVTTSPYGERDFLKDNIPDNLDYNGLVVSIQVARNRAPESPRRNRQRRH